MKSPNFFALGWFVDFQLMSPSWGFCKSLINSQFCTYFLTSSRDFDKWLFWKIFKPQAEFYSRSYLAWVRKGRGEAREGEQSTEPAFPCYTGRFLPHRNSQPELDSGLPQGSSNLAQTLENLSHVIWEWGGVEEEHPGIQLALVPVVLNQGNPEAFTYKVAWASRITFKHPHTTHFKVWNLAASEL